MVSKRSPVQVRQEAKKERRSYYFNKNTENNKLKIKTVTIVNIEVYPFCKNKKV